MDYSPRYGQFRALLRKIREEAGLNQTVLAKKLGRPQTFVSKSELGERRIDFLEVIDFCRACNLPLSKFVERIEKITLISPAKTRRKRRSPRKMDNEGRLTDS